MIVFPNCKINFGLRILRRRHDGYHDLETVFYPVPVKDALEVIPANDITTINITGNTVPGHEADNSCMKAWNLLKQDFPHLQPVSFYLHKAIPAGAGLGGGSADGAFALQLLNTLFEMGLSADQLSSYALQLGSDGPFFIHNKPALGKGRGEMLSPVNLSLKDYTLVLVNPRIHVSTASAFSQITPALPDKPVEVIIQQPVETWRNELINDFELPVFKAHPEIKEIKEKLYQQGASYAAMSGSGSTVYGIFKTQPPALPQFPVHYFVKQC